MSTIVIDAKDVANHIAGLLAPVSVPSERLRRDIGHIQVDHILINERNTDYPAIQFTFDMLNSMGVEIRVRYDDFQADPRGYMRNVLENLGGIRQAALKRRGDSRLTSSMLMANRGAHV